MPQFIIHYRMGNNPPDPSQGDALKQKWMQWINDLGDAVVSPSTPTKPSKTVTNEGVTDTNDEMPLCGYTIIEASDMDAALEIAKSCPHLYIGKLEVAQMMSMGG